MQIHAMPGHLIRRLNQQSTQVFSRHMAEAGVDLTSVQFAAMAAIRGTPGIDQAGVAAEIAYDRATIGGVIDRLVGKGLVERKISPTDRRARVLRLTSEGEAVLDRIQPIVVRLQSEILAPLSEDEQATFQALATRALGLEDG